MKHAFILTFALSLTLSIALSFAAHAQEDTDEIEDGFSLMEEGAKLLFRGILNEMEPALDEFSE